MGRLFYCAIARTRTRDIMMARTRAHCYLLCTAPEVSPSQAGLSYLASASSRMAAAFSISSAETFRGGRNLTV